MPHSWLGFVSFIGLEVLEMLKEPTIHKTEFVAQLPLL
jgi:hypothetical protein